MAESRVIAASAQQQVQFGALRRSSQGFARSGLCPGGIIIPVKRRPLVVVSAASQEGQGEAKEDARRPSEGIFSFVTDNDSSRNAIQLPNAPAQDGNLGQMISVPHFFNRDLSCTSSHSLQLGSIALPQFSIEFCRELHYLFILCIGGA